MCLFTYLALGIHSWGGMWIWENAPILQSWRFPERFLKYVFICALPFAAMGFGFLAQIICKKFPKNYRSITGLMGVLALLDGHRGVGHPQVIHVDQLVPQGLLKELGSDELLFENGGARLIPCYQPLPKTNILGPPPPPTFDTRAWGVPMLAGSEAIQSLVLKSVSCEWVTNPVVQRWLGVTHFVHARVDETSRAFLQAEFGWVYAGEIRVPQFDQTFDVFASINSSPAAAMFVDSAKIGKLFRGSIEPYTMEHALQDGLDDILNRTMLVDEQFLIDIHGNLQKNSPDDSAKIRAIVSSIAPCAADKDQSIKMSLNSFRTLITISYYADCRGLISVPWSFSPGWKLTVNNKPQEILRLGGATIAFLAEPGRIDAQLVFDP